MQTLRSKDGGTGMKCEECEWFRYPLLTDKSLKNKHIPTVIADLRRCERGWCDRQEEEGQLSDQQRDPKRFQKQIPDHGDGLQTSLH